jgi:hypothetical protein
MPEPSLPYYCRQSLGVKVGKWRQTLTVKSLRACIVLWLKRQW